MDMAVCHHLIVYKFILSIEHMLIFEMVTLLLLLLVYLCY